MLYSFNYPNKLPAYSEFKFRIQVFKIAWLVIKVQIGNIMKLYIKNVIMKI